MDKKITKYQPYMRELLQTNQRMIRIIEHTVINNNGSFCIGHDRRLTWYPPLIMKCGLDHSNRFVRKSFRVKWGYLGTIVICYCCRWKMEFRIRWDAILYWPYWTIIRIHVSMNCLMILGRIALCRNVDTSHVLRLYNVCVSLRKFRL